MLINTIYSLKHSHAPPFTLTVFRFVCTSKGYQGTARYDKAAIQAVWKLYNLRSSFMFYQRRNAKLHIKHENATLLLLSIGKLRVYFCWYLTAKRCILKYKSYNILLLN